MKILITGASGLLGLNLALQEFERHTIVGVDRGKLHDTPFELIRADLLEPGACARLIDIAKPEAIIHTAALANLEACESDPDLARAMNVELPGMLAEVCAKHSIPLIHLSTDAVFDGTKDGIYTEDDLPSPPGVYSATKLQGEINVLSAHPSAAIARVNFFGWSLSGTRSLSEFFYNNLSTGKTANGFTDVYFCPLFVGDLADLLVRMLEQKLSGLYHVVGRDMISKYEFGIKIAQQFGFNSQQVIPISVEDSGLKAKRSHNLRLSTHKLSTALGMDIPGVSTGIAKFYTQFAQGYPQKMRSYQQVGDSR
jgi:dTDP-4-dehydrorhamnose reductase